MLFTTLPITKGPHYIRLPTSNFTTTQIPSHQSSILGQIHETYVIESFLQADEIMMELLDREKLIMVPLVCD